MLGLKNLVLKSKDENLSPIVLNYCPGCDPVRSKVEPGGGGGAAPRSRSGRRWETGLQRVCSDDALGFRRLKMLLFQEKNVHL